MIERLNMKYLVAVFGVMLLSSLSACNRSSSDEEVASVDTTKVLIQHIQECSRLYTAEFDVKKVITHDDKVNLQATIFSKNINLGLPLGKRKVAIPMEATLKAYVDFSNFSERNINRNGDRIEVILPDPKVMMTQTKVKNEEIRKDVPLLRSDFTDEEMTNYEKQGRDDIVAAIPQMDIIPAAQEGAAKVLVPLLEQLGFREENITVTFRKEFTFDEIKRLVVND